MSYLLGIKVRQIDDDIFVLKKKYAIDILKWFKIESLAIIHSPIVKKFKMKKEGIGEWVNFAYFKGIVRSLHYLTFNKPNIIYRMRIITRFVKKVEQVTLCNISHQLREEVPNTIYVVDSS